MGPFSGYGGSVDAGRPVGCDFVSGYNSTGQFIFDATVSLGLKEGGSNVGILPIPAELHYSDSPTITSTLIDIPQTVHNSVDWTLHAIETGKQEVYNKVASWASFAPPKKHPWWLP
jgi:hypothetical protein